ncbi:hypothetical protein [Pseudogulbenkiania subflava]|uniref:hypothetical protein n=1 Tax=Pseudogulbenkiania subflava TaxID=451637 RepID=UPI001179EF17|nr:hypothetical protein [Pseudogulbenkiania subflava]
MVSIALGVKASMFRECGKPDGDDLSGLIGASNQSAPASLVQAAGCSRVQFHAGISALAHGFGEWCDINQTVISSPAALAVPGNTPAIPVIAHRCARASAWSAPQQAKSEHKPFTMHAPSESPAGKKPIVWKPHWIT